MKFKNLENHLALLAAVIVLVGVSFAAEDALAKETQDVTNMAADIAAASALEIAEKASKDSAARAAESLALDVLIDLDIKLTDTSSTLTAAKE